MISLSKLKENPENPRRISKERLDALCKSIKEFPKMMSLRPIIIDKDGVILGGNMRYRALKKLGYKEIPDEWVKKDGELTEEERRRFIIVDNNEYGEYDWDILYDKWDKDELLSWGLELPDFDLPEDKVIEDDYEVPEEIETDIKLGDLFEIGQHRLLCGDATKKEDVEKLLNGDKPYLTVTDPPYGVNYDPEWRNNLLGYSNIAALKVKNDDNASWIEVWKLSPSNVFYIWMAGLNIHKTINELLNCKIQARSEIIWRKNNIVISRGHYHWQHESCVYAVRKNYNAKWIGDRKQSTVWEIDKNLKSETGHSTQKPIECMARPIRNHEGDVYDPFLGSGTTMVAAHQLGRKCYGMEIEPKYCQIVIDRMKKLDPNIKIVKNGRQTEG